MQIMCIENMCPYRTEFPGSSGGVGFGPSTNSSFEEPAYCRPPTTPCVLSKYRSQDGSCNNLEHPLTWGVANTPFRRALPAAYGDGKAFFLPNFCLSFKNMIQDCSYNLEHLITCSVSNTPFKRALSAVLVDHGNW